jgi:hypothetical protein
LGTQPFRAATLKTVTRQFQKHYSRDEARALLPQIREWLGQLQELRQKLDQQDARIGQFLKTGQEMGGKTVNQFVRLLAETKGVLEHFRQRQIQVKDLDRGLIDFPAIIAGREVFLCWEQDEEDIEFWHDIDTGYAGRERL